MCHAAGFMGPNRSMGGRKFEAGAKRPIRHWQNVSDAQRLSQWGLVGGGFSRRGRGAATHSVQPRIGSCSSSPKLHVSRVQSVPVFGHGDVLLLCGALHYTSTLNVTGGSFAGKFNRRLPLA